MVGGVLGTILSNSAGKLVDGIGNALDKNITSTEERMQAKAEITKIATDLMDSLTKEASTVIQVEASGNWLQRSWRPITMLIFVFIVVYSKFVGPAFNLPVPKLEVQFWELLKYGIVGYVGGRSVEKITGTILNNVNIVPGRKRKKNE